MRERTPMTDRQVYTRILLLLGIAAALPLLPAGMFAGLALALLVGWWLMRAGAVTNKRLLWALFIVVAMENAAFMIGFLR